MLLCALDMLVPTHQTAGLWRHPDAQTEQYRDVDFWVRHAQMLEKAGFDAMFFADVAGVYDVYGGSGATAVRAGMQYPLLDPMMLISALAQATSTIGFGVTGNVTYESPYLLARRLTTLDHLSRGRIAWNIVTGYQPQALHNAGGEVLPHDQRYDRADEFMDVVYALWEGSIAPDALVHDVASNTYMDPARIRPVEHSGHWFDVHGPAVALPGPQRTPFLFQAGSSPRGIQFAARHAEALFFSGTTPENVAPLVRAAHEQAAGRPLKTIASITLITAETTAAAQDRYQSYLDCVDPQAALALFAGWTGLDLAGCSPDEPLAAVIARNGDIDGNRSATQSFTALDPDHEWTVGELAAQMAIGGRGPVVVGNPAEVVDELQRWMEVAGVDGFNTDYALRDKDMQAVCELICPELRRRGLLADAPSPTTLRARVTGADWLAAPHPGAAFRDESEES